MLPEIKNILYTTNLGDGTRPVLRYAMSLAKTHNAKLTLLHVVEPLSDAGSFLIEAYLSEEMVREVEGVSAKLRANISQKVLDKIKGRLERFCAEELGTSPDHLSFIGDIAVVSGPPAEVILQEAENRDIDLIIIGSHADSSLKNVLLGSTARKVTLMSKKPVLVVPMQEAASWGD